MLGTEFKILGFAHPYGICMALGIIGCFGFLLFTMTKRNFNEEAIDKMLLMGIFATGFGIFMAMVFQALYDYIANPSMGFDLGQAMTFQGGLIGGVVGFLSVWNLYVFVIAPRAQKAITKLESSKEGAKPNYALRLLSNNMNASLSDALPFVPPSITIAHAFGRLGCTFAGCCHGAQTEAWYGIWMHTVEFGYAKVVPTQLFECLFLVALTAIMVVLYFKFKFKYNFGVYAIAYGVWRCVIEVFRDDYRGSFIGALTPSQFWSIIMIVLGVGFFFLQYFVLSKFMKHPELQPPVREPKAKKAAVAVGETEGTAEETSEAVADEPVETTAEPEPVEEPAESTEEPAPVEEPAESTEEPAPEEEPSESTEEPATEKEEEETPEAEHQPTEDKE